MAGLKAKISHALGRDNKDTSAAHTGAGSGTGTGTGAGSGMATTGAGSGMGTTGTGSGMGKTGTGMGTTGTGMGTTGSEHHHHSGTTGDLHTGGVTGATGGGGGGGFDTTGVNTTGVRGGGMRTDDEVIDSETFTKTEDHEVVIEKKKYELEHRPVEKQYKVETKYMGERGVPGGPTQLLGTEEREVDERVKEAPRGDREIIVENVDIPGGALRSGGATR